MFRVVYGYSVLGETLRLTVRLLVTSVVVRCLIVTSKALNCMVQALLTTHRRLVLVGVVGEALGFLRTIICVVPLLMAAKTDNFGVYIFLIRIPILLRLEHFVRDLVLLAVG